MYKYLSVFRISLIQEFAYRMNFIMWRVRNVMGFFLIFFLWDSVFSDPQRVLFGYDRARILTYVFGILLIKSIVTSVRSIDIAGEISQGNLANYLIKPISYFKYWFTRDLASKLLNIFFAVFEIAFLYIILRPPFYFQIDFLYLSMFFISLALAIILFFLLMTLVNLFPLWYPEQSWGMPFLLLIFADLLGGGVFPLDILPSSFQQALNLSPFPYLIFTPIQIYLGKLDPLLSIKGILIAFLWVGILSYFLKVTWNAGLKAYRAEGR